MTNTTLQTALDLANPALKGIVGAMGKATDTKGRVASFNADMARATALAVVGDCFKDFSEQVQKHGNFKYFKATVSQAKATALHAKAGNSLTVPASKKGGRAWTVAGKVFGEGESVPASDILATMTSPTEGDTSPLVIGKAASAVRAKDRAERSAQAQATENALLAYLNTPEGRAMVRKGGQWEGMTAADIIAENRDENGTATPALQSAIVAGEAAIADLDRKADQAAILANRETAISAALATLETMMDDDLAGKVSAILSKYRASKATTAQGDNRHVAQAA